MHDFIVQIRSMEDHQPLPGVTVAGIGMEVDDQQKLIQKLEEDILKGGVC